MHMDMDSDMFSPADMSEQDRLILENEWERTYGGDTWD